MAEENEIAMRLPWVSITQRDLDSLLSVYGLAPAQTKVERLPGGVANLHLRLATPEADYVMRVYRYRSRSRVVEEIELLKFLAERNFPTAYPVTDKLDNTISEIEGNPVVLFKFISGRQLESQNLDLRQLRECGRFLGQLHKVGVDYPPATNRWQGDPEQIQSLYRERSAEVKQRASQLFRKAEPYLQNLFALKIPVHLPKGLVHSDWRAENFLFSDSGRLLVVLDFDNFYHGFWLTDIATADYWLGREGNRLSFSRIRYCHRGYNKFRSLTDHEKEAWPGFIRFATLKNMLFGLLVSLEGDDQFGQQAVQQSMKVWDSIPDDLSYDKVVT